MDPTDTLAAALNDALPQTQCTRCGYPDCAAYAHAIAHDQAPIDQCPPGGRQGIARLAQVTGRPVLPLNPVHGVEGPLRLALIDETWCIGCTLCIKACPVDCIVGAPKLMHTVIASQCTGCELCLPVCPVDCITMIEASGTATGRDAWSDAQAQQARTRYTQRTLRLARERRENNARLAAKAADKLAHLEEHTQITDPALLERKRVLVAAAMARARARNAP